MAGVIFYPDDPAGLAIIETMNKITEAEAEQAAEKPWAIHYENCRCSYCH